MASDVGTPSDYLMSQATRLITWPSAISLVQVLEIPET